MKTRFCLLLFWAMTLPVSAQVLDESWTVTVNGRSVRVNPDGTFRIDNIPSPDNFGAEGPGSPPDFLGDDFVRLVGTRTRGGVTEYVFSDPFLIANNETFRIGGLTFSTTPPPMPVSLRVDAETSALQVDETVQLRVFGEMADVGEADLTDRTAWTVYRTSNRRTVTVGRDGLVTAREPGRAFITAVNDGAVAVKRLIVALDVQQKTLEGYVRYQGGPVAGVTVTTDLGDHAETDSRGFFSMTATVPADTALGLYAETEIDGEPLHALALVERGVSDTVDAGILELVPGRDRDGDGLADDLEAALGYRSDNPDSDGDGTLDGDEDRDFDGLSNRLELVLGLNPGLSDSDDDGLNDGLEDSDADGLTNVAELAAGTNLTMVDSDNDGMSDFYEVTYGLDPNDLSDALRDFDNDGRTNLAEALAETDPFDPDTTPPVLTASFPADAATAVPLNHRLVLRFDGTMSTRVDHFGTVTMRAGETVVSGSLFRAHDGLGFTFRPDQNLAADTMYEVTLDQFRDRAGNLQNAPVVLRFTTGAATDTTPPTQVLVSPKNNQTGVPRNARLLISFNAAVDPATLEGLRLYNENANQYPEIRYQLSPDLRTLTLATRDLLAAGHTFRSLNQQALQDLSGNGFSPSTTRFQTAFDSDQDPALLLRHSPADGTQDVPVNTRIQWLFQDPMQSHSFAEGLRITIGGNPVAGRFVVTENGLQVTFEADTDFPADSRIDVAYTEALRDSAGNALSNPGTFSFTTGSLRDTRRPFLVTLRPLNNAVAVPINVQPTLIFDEALDPLSLREDRVYVQDREGLRVPARLELTGEGRLVRILPAEPLAPATAFLIYANGLRDLAGNVASTSLVGRFTTQSPIGDTQPPLLVAANPGADDIDVALNTVIRAVFDEPVQLDPALPILFRDGDNSPVAGTLTAEEGTRSLVFRPEQALTATTRYRVALGAVRDLAGNAAATEPWIFTTADAADTTRPTVVSFEPSPGTTGMSITQPLTVHFSEVMDPTSVNANSMPVTVTGVDGVQPGTYQVNGSQVVFTPEPPVVRDFPYDREIRFRVESTVRDRAGNPCRTADAVYFTGSGEDRTAPFVVSMDPAADSVAVGPDASIVLFFSESLNPAGLTREHFAVFVDEEEQNISVAHSLDNRTVTLRATLPYEAEITVVATDGVTDLAGNALAPFTGVFHSQAPPQTAQPRVIDVSPPPSRRVLRDRRPIVLTFDHPLDPTSLDGALYVTDEGNPKPGNWVLSPDGLVLVFTPTTPYRPQRSIDVFLLARATGVDGVPVVARNVRLLTVESDEDLNPRIVHVSGQGQAVATNTVFSVLFSEPMDELTIDADTVTLFEDNGNRPIDFRFSDDGRVLTLTPREPLLPDQSYTLFFSNEVRDLQGVSLGNQSYSTRTGDGFDTQAPMLILTSPAAGDSGIPVNTALRFRFDEPPTRATLKTADLSILADGRSFDLGDIHLENDVRDLVIELDQPLPPNRTVRVQLSGLRDSADNLVAPISLSFETAVGLDVTAPVLSTTVPLQNSSHNGSGTRLAMMFNEPLDPGGLLFAGYAVRADNDPVAGALSLSDDLRTLSFVPQAPLPLGADVRFGVGGIRDLAGNSSSAELHFKVGFDRDAQAPMVITSSPPDGLTDVPTNAVLSILFDEAVVPATLEHLRLLGPDDVPVPHRAQLSQGNRRLSATFDGLLLPETTYRLQLDRVEDPSGNAAVAPVVTTFTTGPVPDLGADPFLVMDPGDNTGLKLPLSPSLGVALPTRVDPTSVDRDSMYLTDVQTGRRLNGHPVVAANLRRVDYVLEETLLPSRNYRFSVVSMRDLSGRRYTQTATRNYQSADRDDDTAPVLVAATPHDGAVDVPVNAQVTIAFDEPTVARDAFEAVLTGPEGLVPVRILFDYERRYVHFRPVRPLTPATEYQFTLATLRDLAGNAADPITLSFTTRADATPDNLIPRIESLVPVTGATEVVPNSPMVFTFNEPVGAASIRAITITADNVPVVGSFAVDDAVVTFTPQAGAIPTGNRSIQIRISQVPDLCGNLQGSTSSWFTTGPLDDQIPAQVTEVLPANGAQDVDPGRDVVLVFSEPLDPASTTDGVHLFADGEPLYAQVGASNDPRVLRVVAGLPADASILVVGGGLRDLAGNAITPFTSRFTTGPSAQTGVTEIDQIVVSRSGQDVLPGTAVTVHFNKVMNLANLSGQMVVVENGLRKTGHMEVPADRSSLTFYPNDPFQFEARVGVFVENLSDRDGRLMNPYETTFTVAGDPAAQTARLLAFSGEGEHVPTNAVFTFRYSRALDRARLGDAVFSMSGDRNVLLRAILSKDGLVLRLVPDLPLAGETRYNIRVTNLFDTFGHAVTNFVNSFTTGPGPDTIPPGLLGFSPPPGAVVAVNSRIHLRFDEPINPASISTQTVRLSDGNDPIPYTFSVDPTGRSLIISPIQPLPPDGTFGVTVSQVLDLADLPLPAQTFQLTTHADHDVTRPRRIAALPAPGSENVPVNAVLHVVFDEPMDAGSFNETHTRFLDVRSGAPVPATLSLDPGGRMLTVAPAQPLALLHPYRFEIFPGVTDLAGNHLNGSYDQGFTTGVADDRVPPRLLQVSPADNQTGLPRNAVVQLGFDEPIDGSALAAVTVSSDQGEPVSTVRSLSQGNRLLELRFPEGLAAATRHRIQVHGVRDLSGNVLADTIAGHFNTGLDFDLTAPRVRGTAPSNAQSAVPANTWFTAFFSEPVKPITLTESSVSLTQGSRAIAARLVTSHHNTRVTLIPDQPLIIGAQYRFSVTTAVQDESGRGLSGGAVVTVTIGADSDLTPPQRISLSPRDGAVDVPVNTRVSFTVDEPIQPLAVDGESVVLRRAGEVVPAGLQVSESRIVLTPHAPLSPGVGYRFQVQGLTDLAGHPLAAFQSTFTTRNTSDSDSQGPVLVSISPTQAATDVVRTTPITVVFDEPIDAATVTANHFEVTVNGADVPGSRSIQGNVLTFTPLPEITRTPPANARVVIQLSSFLTDTAGNRFSGYSGHYFTHGDADVVAPRVVAVTPPDHAFEVGRSTPVSLVFSEALDPATLRTENFEVTHDGQPASFSVQRSDDNRVIRLNQSIDYDTRVAIRVLPGLTDTGGNGALPFDVSFRTRAQEDQSRPSVVEILARQQSGRLLAGTLLTAVFDRPMDPASVVDNLYVVENGSLKAGTVSVSGDGTRATFIPHDPFLYGSVIVLQVTDEALSATGMPAFAYDTVLRMIGDPAFAGPSRIHRFGDEDGTPVNAVFRIGYNEPLDPDSLSQDAVVLEQNGAAVLFQVGLVEPHVLRIQPSVPLASDARVRLALPTQTITDREGQAIPRFERSFTPGTVTDTQPAALRAVSPQPDSKGALLNGRLSFLFSEPVDPFSLPGGITLTDDQGAVPGTFAFLDGQEQVLFIPDRPLRAETTHTVRVEAVLDRAENTTPTQSFTFTSGNTSNRNVISSDLPHALHNNQAMPTNAQLTVMFPHMIDALSIEGDNLILSDSVAGAVDFQRTLVADGFGVRLVPSTPLVPDRSYQLLFRLTRDIAGYNVYHPRITFTAGALADDTAPTLLAMTPTQNETDVDLLALIHLEFDEPLDAAAMRNGVLVHQNGTPVPGTLVLSNDTRELTWRPAQPLAPNTTYEVTVQGVTDLAGNTLANQTVTFTTEP